ncbi:MAG TPA: hypothetical protein VHP31_07065 [Caproicibacter sp.]|nr:hypothetical protein [Caproicibacter sp.]
MMFFGGRELWMDDGEDEDEDRKETVREDYRRISRMRMKEVEVSSCQHLLADAGKGGTSMTHSHIALTVE